MANDGILELRDLLQEHGTRRGLDLHLVEHVEEAPALFQAGLGQRKWAVVADETTRRTFAMQVLLATSADLPAGRFARITSRTGTRTAVWLPRSAVVSEGQLQGAYVVRRDRALLRWLRLGVADGEDVEILSGLDEGDTVAVAVPGLRDGMRVTGG